MYANYCKTKEKSVNLRCISFRSPIWGQGRDADIINRKRLLRLFLTYRNLANSKSDQGYGNGRCLRRYDYTQPRKSRGFRRLNRHTAWGFGVALPIPTGNARASIGGESTVPVLTLFFIHPPPKRRIPRPNLTPHLKNNHINLFALHCWNQAAMPFHSNNKYPNPKIHQQWIIQYYLAFSRRCCWLSPPLPPVRRPL